MKKENDPSKLDVWNAYHFQGKVTDLINELQDIVKQHPKATITMHTDYSCCYYESDSPEVQFIIRSK